METTPRTIQQLNRAIRKIADKFPQVAEPTVLTDIHMRVSPETGELLALDDSDVEITRCVVEDWIGATDEDFYEQVTAMLRKALLTNRELIDAMSILKPYSFVLENDELDVQEELYVVDGDTVIIDPVIMDDLDDDLDAFFDKLMKD